MFKKLLKKLVRKVDDNPVIVEAVSEKVDDVIMDVLDSQTGGLASKAERAVKRRKARSGR